MGLNRSPVYASSRVEVKVVVVVVVADLLTNLSSEVETLLDRQVYASADSVKLPSRPGPLSLSRPLLRADNMENKGAINIEYRQVILSSSTRSLWSCNHHYLSSYVPFRGTWHPSRLPGSNSKQYQQDQPPASSPVRSRTRRCL